MRLLIRPRRPVLTACRHARNPFLVTRLPRQWLSTSSPVCLCPTKANTAAANTTELKGLRQPQSTELPDSPCRTRFAPSPTGFLHLGSLRTALYNYLLAKATGGQFILRIEDTDQARTVPGAEERLYKDLQWAGLSWDEGPDVAGPYGPYRQSERLDLYHQHAKILLDKGHAYRCFCSPKVLQEHTRLALEKGAPTTYPGTCRSISPEESNERASKGEPHAIRFLSPDKPVRFVDLVYGPSREREPPEEFVIIKRDGFPTYHFANVVDDKHMKITHVIRGAEWLISTPKHVAMYDAFGWQPPQFAHVGLLVDEQRQKLSKRHAGVDISEYQNNATLPVALLNFSVLLGWSKAQKKGANSDVMTLQEMIDNFSLKFTRGDIKVNFGKLGFLQEQHMLRITQSPEEVLRYREQLIEPVDRILRAVQTAVEEKRDGPTESVSYAPSGLDLEDLDAPVAAMTRSDSASREQYIAKVLSICTRKAKDGKSDARDFVLTNRYLFWDMPLSVLKRCDPLPKSEFEILPSSGAPVGFPQVVDYLEDTLFKVSEEEWTDEGLGEALSKAANNILYHTPEHQKGPKAGPTYLILRRALCGMDHGPGVAQIMGLLGRAETMKRIRALRYVDWSPAQHNPKISSSAKMSVKIQRLAEAVDTFVHLVLSNNPRRGVILTNVPFTRRLVWPFRKRDSNMATEDSASRQRYIANAISICKPVSKESEVMEDNNINHLEDLEGDAAAFLYAHSSLFFRNGLMISERIPWLSRELDVLPSGTIIDTCTALKTLQDELSAIGDDRWTANVLRNILSSATGRLVWRTTPGEEPGDPGTAVCNLLSGALYGVSSSCWDDLHGSWGVKDGDDADPPLAEAMALFGKQETMERLSEAQEAIRHFQKCEALTDPEYKDDPEGWFKKYDLA